MKLQADKVFGIILIAFLFNACQFNQSSKKDLITGAYSRGDGLGADDAKIEVNGKVENRNTFVYGEKVNFIFNNIRGLKTKDGKSYPGLSMYILQEKDTVFSEANLIADLTKDGTDLSPLQLHANFRAALPVGRNYKVHLNIWDQQGEGKLSYEMPFEVKESKLLEITSSNIKYSSIYLWNESKKLYVLDKNIDQNDQLVLIAEKLNGLKNVDGKVYPIFSIDLEDSKGNKILSNPNVLSQYESEGINVDDLSDGHVPITITFTKGKIFNPCILTATLIDKNSSNRIDIKSELIIE